MSDTIEVVDDAADGFIMFPNWVANHPTIRREHATKSVYIGLKQAAYLFRGLGAPTQADIATLAGVTDKTLRKGLRLLEDIGAVEVTRITTSEGRQPSRYRIVSDPQTEPNGTQYRTSPTVLSTGTQYRTSFSEDSSYIPPGEDWDIFETNLDTVLRDDPGYVDHLRWVAEQDFTREHLIAMRDAMAKKQPKWSFSPKSLQKHHAKLERWVTELATPAEKKITEGDWCKTHGHRFAVADGLWTCAVAECRYEETKSDRVSHCAEHGHDWSNGDDSSECGHCLTVLVDFEVTR